MKQKTISFISALLISIGSYIYLSVNKSMCYYSVDGLPKPISYELMKAIRNKCYAEFSLGRIIPEIFFGFVISFLAIYGLLEIILELRKNKSIA